MIFTSVHKCFMGFSSGLCDDHSNTFTLLAASHCVMTFDFSLGCLMLHNSIYFLKCTNPFSIKTPPRHDAATPICFTVRMMSFGLKASACSLHIYTAGHCGQMTSSTCEQSSCPYWLPKRNVWHHEISGLVRISLAWVYVKFWTLNVPFGADLFLIVS